MNRSATFMASSTVRLAEQREAEHPEGLGPVGAADVGAHLAEDRAAGSGSP